MTSLNAPSEFSTRENFANDAIELTKLVQCIKLAAPSCASRRRQNGPTVAGAADAQQQWDANNLKQNQYQDLDTDTDKNGLNSCSLHAAAAQPLNSNQPPIPPQMSTGRHDTLREIDARYHLAEADQGLRLEPRSDGTRRIGLALVGVGRMGAIHLYNVMREPRANLLYILDSDRERLEFFSKKYFLAERQVRALTHDQFNVLLEDERVEALFISTPTFTHEPYAKLGLQHGKHILCEKPLAEDLSSIESLCELAKERRLKLICALNRRYDPSFRRIREQAQRGDIGQLRLIKTCSRDSPLPPLDYIRISGGIFHDCMVHDIDLVMWVARELPDEVHSYACTHLDDYKSLDDFDVALTSLHFPSNLLASIDISRVSKSGYDQRLEVFGTEGTLKLDEFPPENWEKHTDIGVVRPNNAYSFASRYADAYANEVADLFNHIEGNQTLENTDLWYLSALNRVVVAAEQSARENRPIKIEWTQEELARSRSLSDFL